MFKVLLTSAIKFLLAPPLAAKMGFSFIQTFLTTALGGIAGVLFFFILSEWLIKQWATLWPNTKLFFKNISSSKEKIKLNKVKTKRRIFNSRNRRFVRIFQKYSYHGLVILTPVLFSIPIGTFLTTKYYAHKRNILIYLSFSVICWALIISSLSILFHIH
ncbi:MAG: hypothetical protein PHD97_12275 [Bacteroidales bacterium]|nr:hypothetical protein [Bacteroidales bacterium]